MKLIRPQTAEEFNAALARDVDGLKRRLGVVGWAKPYPTSERPDPDGRLGQCIFDTDLGKPIWSRGDAWVDATGALV